MITAIERLPCGLTRADVIRLMHTRARLFFQPQKAPIPVWKSQFSREVAEIDRDLHLVVAVHMLGFSAEMVGIAWAVSRTSITKRLQRVGFQRSQPTRGGQIPEADTAGIRRPYRRAPGQGFPLRSGSLSPS